MFERSTTDDRRVRIVDVMHLCYKYAYGGATALSTTLKVNGTYVEVDTTIQSYVIKALHRYSKYGYYPLVVCFDTKGCGKSRKAYFTKNEGGDNDNVNDYKGARESQDSKFYESINMMKSLLVEGGVTCLWGEGYEADDLIMATVEKAKKTYPNLPIDVITGDADLLPLVDDQVSVYITSRVTTWAESGDIEIKHYFQARPHNLQEYCEGITAFKNLKMPYNTVLLAKLLRGDKSDGISGYPKFTPTKYKNLIQQLEEDNVDIGNLFRYDAPTQTYCYRNTEEPIPIGLIDSTPKENMMIKFGEPPKLTEMCEVLSKYLDEDVIRHIRFVYKGINLNAAYTGLGDTFNRRPATIKAEIKGYSSGQLNRAVAPLSIRLPLG